VATDLPVRDGPIDLADADACNMAWSALSSILMSWASHVPCHCVWVMAPENSSDDYTEALGSSCITARVFPEVGGCVVLQGSSANAGWSCCE